MAQEKRQRRRKITSRDFAAIHCIALSALGNAGISLNDLEDIEQELALKLVRKAHLFRKSSLEWSAFRRAVLLRCLADIINTRNKPKVRQIFINGISLDKVISPENGPESEELTLGELVTAEGLMADGSEKPELPGADLKIDMEIFIKSLSPCHQRICRSLMVRSPRDTMRQLKIPKSSLYRHLNEIREAMKKAGLDSYI